MKAPKNLLNFLPEETLAESPKVVGHDILNVLSDGVLGSFAEDLSRSMPFINDVNESLLNDKGMISRQHAGTKCNP
jgi:hypothetical protein